MSKMLMTLMSTQSPQWADYADQLPWRSPSGATEDRNSSIRSAARTAFKVAVALWGDRGSQPHGRTRGRREATRGGRPLGRPRIATLALPVQHRVAGLWRSPSGATEDRNDLAHVAARDAIEGGGRPLGRPRIATYTTHCSASIRYRRWRSPSGATEDRNSSTPGGAGGIRAGGGRPLGRPRIATDARTRLSGSTAEWRSPSGATEDRNYCGNETCKLEMDVAVALWGDRGSQRPVRGPSQRRGRRGGRPLGRPRIATEWGRLRRPLSGGGGRPLGRPRIATTALQSGRIRRRRWRSPAGATEDRNVMSTLGLNGTSGGWRSPSGATEDRNYAEQHTARRIISCGGRPLGRPRIATGRRG